MFLTLADGCRLFFDVESPLLRPHGDRLRQVPTLIALHGGPGFDHAAFRAFLPALRDEVQILYYDHRGMGRSDRTDTSLWNLPQWGQDLAELIQKLEIERPILFGQSFGGFVALEYATKHLGSLGGVVLSSTAARNVPGESIDQFERLGGVEGRAVAKRFLDDPTPANLEDFTRVCLPLYNTTKQNPDISKWTIMKPEVLEHFDRGEFLSMNYLGEMAKIECPLMIVCGTEDPITPTLRSQEMHDAMNGRSSLHVVEGAGHGVYRDKPDVFQQLLLEFIARCGAVTA